MDPGTRIGHFEIIAPLGAGGMGEVYRARDANLRREVAVKVLPEDLTGDEERLLRLEREARLLASLNHGNIATIHSLEREGDTRFLVMELIEGETLAEVLQSGSMPIDRALDLGQQIAEALQAAHEAGVIHRDLKPANVMITPRGKAKVLDFGIAKATSGGDAPPETTHSPTEAQALTAAGTLLGTTSYMSPEQVRGQQLDKRSDIWSFGCLLYEMLTRARAFRRETVSDTLAAILEHEPDWSLLPAETPPLLRSVLVRCLRKDPGRRLHDIADARIEIGEALIDERSDPAMAAAMATAAPPPEAPAFTTPAKRRAGGIALAVIAVVAAAGLVWQFLPERAVVCLIDTSAPLGVYDPRTRTSGGTNADDLSDVLGDLPVTLVKETASPQWHREHQVLMQDPALILVHLSAFAHQPGHDEYDALGSALAEAERLGLESPMLLGRAKLVGFLGYIALGNPQTRFVVYSRGLFEDTDAARQWVAQAEARFPNLAGRITTYDVPGDVGTATFRDPETGAEIRRLVESILGNQ